jgi:hypothetical protein
MNDDKISAMFSRLKIRRHFNTHELTGFSTWNFSPLQPLQGKQLQTLTRVHQQGLQQF